MYTGGARRRLSHLWQLPLLLLSLGLFSTTACLYVDARPGITLNQKLSVARQLMRDDRPDSHQCPSPNRHVCLLPLRLHASRLRAGSNLLGAQPEASGQRTRITQE